MLVRDIPDNFTLVTDSQDIAAVAESIGAPDLAVEFGCLFVDVQDGDYGVIYGWAGSMPGLDNTVHDVDYYLNSARYQLEQRCNDVSSNS